MGFPERFTVDPNRESRESFFASEIPSIKSRVHLYAFINYRCDREKLNYSVIYGLLRIHGGKGEDLPAKLSFNFYSNMTLSMVNNTPVNTEGSN